MDLHITKQLLVEHGNVDLRTGLGNTVLKVADRGGHNGVDTLIRNKKHKNDDRWKEDTLL